jgi:hypothetical protein
VLEGTIGSLDDLGPVFCDFNPHALIAKYGAGGWYALVDDILGSGFVKKQPRLAERSIFPLFCRSVMCGAEFFSRFDGVTEFYQWADSLYVDNRSRIGLPLILSAEIWNLGFALACDFLKEIGYDGYGKPDVQIKEIFRRAGLMVASTNDKNEDISAFKAILRVAANTGTTAYEVDRLFWLVGSGYFFRTNLPRFTNQKEAFFEMLDRELTTVTA